MQVPQVKRRLEQLLFMLKGVIEASTIEGRILVGNLKHKNLDGTVVPSQLCPHSSEDEDEDEDEDADENQGEAATGNRASIEDEGEGHMPVGDEDDEELEDSAHENDSVLT